MAGKKKSSWQKIRKLFNDIHLWLGLASGLIVVVVCFSGTLYTFSTEITEAGASHLYKVEVPKDAKRIPADSALAKVAAISGGRVTSIQIPHDPARTYQLGVRKKDDKSRFGTTYMVNPYSGEILGTSNDKNSAKEFMSVMFSLHRWLLLDKVEKPILNSMENRKLGSAITGYATIIFTLGCITGLVIWFPQKIKTWRQGLKIKWKANWKRVNHDLHNTLAFYSLIFLLLMGLTGPQWSFEWYRDGLQKTLGTYKKKDEGGREGRERSAGTERKEGGEQNRAGERNKSEQKEEITVMPLQEIVRSADQALQYRGNYFINFPQEADGNINVSKTRIGFFAPAAGDRLTINAQSGKIVKTDIFRGKPFNERIAGSIKALHTGNVYGTFTKIIYFIACLIATSLPVTGTLIWVNKMKKKSRPSPVKPLVVSPVA